MFSQFAGTKHTQ